MYALCEKWKPAESWYIPLNLLFLCKSTNDCVKFFFQHVVCIYFSRPPKHYFQQYACFAWIISQARVQLFQPKRNRGVVKKHTIFTVRLTVRAGGGEITLNWTEMGPTNDPWMISDEFETIGDQRFWRWQTKTKYLLKKLFILWKSRKFIQTCIHHKI